MKSKVLSLILALMLPLFGYSKESILKRVISIEIVETPVINILQTIEVLGKVQFSYNPEVIDEDRIVSLSIKEKTIEYGLSLIFDNSIRFKEVGTHIVLLKNETKAEIKVRKKEKSDYIFTGIITDAETGNPISGASIYDVDSRFAGISDVKGYYELKIPKSESIRSLYFSKKGYQEKVIVVDGEKSEDLINNISLTPLKDIDKIEPTHVTKIENPVEENAFSGALVSEEVYIHSENLSAINDSRIAQISLVPSFGIGSNLSTNGLVTNNISLNILAGYSNGVNGIEIGGLLNIVKGNVVGCQIGGIANMVGGDVEGVQIGGIANLIQGNVVGAQLGGISCIVKGDVMGTQISGFSSIVRGGFNGVQISGFSNLVFNNSYGTQISGFCNVVKDSLYGGQVSGFVNYASGGINTLQVAGFTNFSGKNLGLQASGFFNFAKENNGLQVSVFNSSIRGDGIAIGLFNFVKEGYHKTEISANEVFPANLTFKTGTKRLYNSYSIGVQFGENPAYGMGLGYGSYFDLSEKLQLSLDLTAQMVFENQFQAFEFTQLYKFSVSIDYKIADWVTIFAGPSFNTSVMQFQNGDGEYISNIGLKPFHQENFNNGTARFWIGGSIGFRF